MVRPIEIQFTTHVAAAPAEEGQAAPRAAAATMRVTGYFYGTFLAF